MFVSYAQNFEDVMLWRALGHIEAGCYIDIGAQDPVIDSVSLAFHERGWRGIHVEPTLHYAALLREQRGGDVVIQAAVGERAGIMTLFEFPDTGLSTLDAAVAARAAKDGFPMRESATPVVPLASVLETWPGREIHWMKLDIEGFETQALRGWADCPARPWVVVVESTLPRSQEQAHAAWEPLLLERGYRFVYFDGLNRYYVAAGRDDLHKAFAAPPNVFDDFAINGTASNHLHHAMVSRHEHRLEVEQSNARLERAQAATTLQELRDRHATETTETERTFAERATQAQHELQLAREAVSNQAGERAARERELYEQLHATQTDAARHLATIESEHRARINASHREHAAERAANAAAQGERERFIGEQALACEALLREQVTQATRYAEALAGELDRLEQSWPWRLVHPFGTTKRRAALLPFANAREAPAAATASPSTSEEPAMSNDPYAVQTAACADDLLDLHDAAFARSAYLTILGRPADPTGLAGLTRQLRSGADKEQLLASLATSEEGRTAKAAAELPGLSQLVERARRARPSFAIRASRRLARIILEPLFNRLRDIDGQLQELSQSLHMRLDRLETAVPTMVQGSAVRTKATTEEREALGQTSLHGREIYFSLKDAAAEKARIALS
jgi:FkbM family methyltransferase